MRRLFDRTEVLRLTDEACSEAARIYARLESRGKMINEFELLIAGIVIASEETFVAKDAFHRDRRAEAPDLVEAAATLEFIRQLVY